MDHVVNEGTYGTYEGLSDKYYEGRSPGAIYIPRFQNLNSDTKPDFVLRYGIQAKGKEKLGNKTYCRYRSFVKSAISNSGRWKVSSWSWGSAALL
jgi:hypothetical protein